MGTETEQTERESQRDTEIYNKLTETEKTKTLSSTIPMAKALHQWSVSGWLHLPPSPWQPAIQCVML